ncbi:hypothetical protein, partial [Paraburkholderia caribensis]|uniref:hypothetical protein n=1 Tax=Paraburkholderia caribensis TaxID=75105 RepID=UPI001CC48DB4
MFLVCRGFLICDRVGLLYSHPRGFGGGLSAFCAGIRVCTFAARALVFGLLVRALGVCLFAGIRRFDFSLASADLTFRWHPPICIFAGIRELLACF